MRGITPFLFHSITHMTPKRGSNGIDEKNIKSSIEFLMRGNYVILLVNLGAKLEDTI
jgi:hypothetical protein